MVFHQLKARKPGRGGGARTAPAAVPADAGAEQEGLEAARVLAQVLDLEKPPPGMVAICIPLCLIPAERRVDMSLFLLEFLAVVSAGSGAPGGRGGLTHKRR